MPHTETNVEIVRRGYEAAARGELDVIAELLDPDVKWHGGDPSALGACNGREEALAFMRGARAREAFGELVDVIDAGDSVVVVMRPNAPDAPQARLRANVTTFRGGKVVEMVAHESPAAALEAAGL